MIPTKFWIYIHTIDEKTADEDAVGMYKTVDMPYLLKAGDHIRLLDCETDEDEPEFQKTIVRKATFNLGAMRLEAYLRAIEDLPLDEYTETVEDLTANGWQVE